MRIDLNADLGEECGDDVAMFACVSSANIACGGHAGTESTMRQSIAEAVRRGVVVGAHVSYPDRAGFGRAPMDLPYEILRQSLLHQIQSLQAFATRADTSVQYVKPHGALYHRVAHEPAQAMALIDATLEALGSVDLLVPDSALIRESAAGMRCRSEFFADRGYDAQGRLVSRGSAGAQIEDPDQVVSRTLNWLRTGTVETIDGTAVRLRADSICLHGDSPTAVRSAQALRAALVSESVTIAHWPAA